MEKPCGGRKHQRYIFSMTMSIFPRVVTFFTIFVSSKTGKAKIRHNDVNFIEKHPPTPTTSFMLGYGKRLPRMGMLALATLENASIDMSMSLLHQMKSDTKIQNLHYF
jgi:hypothetical protein